MIKLLKGFDIRVRIMNAEHKHHRFCGTVIGSYAGAAGRGGCGIGALYYVLKIEKVEG